MRRSPAIAIFLLMIGVFCATRVASAQMRAYQTRYYVIHTDLDEDTARESAIRMTKMAEEYHDRTRDFSGTIRQKLPLYLFNDRLSYMDAGGMPGTAGVFTGTKLMACADEHVDPRLWHTLQHEGFHQFANAVIGGELPIWVNEGMAEYFGEGVFTGDGFVTGVIPHSRLQRVQKTMRAGGYKSIERMMMFSHMEWNMEMAGENYDQAWSMVHFLAHGDNGKYQRAFSKFMIDIGKNKQWEKAWQDNFGDAGGFEERWKEYWLNLPDNPTAALYGKATAETLTSFLARAVGQKQTFATFDEFKKTADAGELKSHREDWLPPQLLKEAMKLAADVGEWEILANGNKPPMLVLTLTDGTKVVGTFALRANSGRVNGVFAEIDDLPKTIAEAKSLADSGQRDQARNKLRESLKKHPNSPWVGEGQKLMGQIR